MTGSRQLAGALLALATLTALAGGVAAQPKLPPGVFAGERDAATAPAGSYAIDPTHTSVIAKVSHIGYGLSVFRFDKVEGLLTWDPAHLDDTHLTTAVATASIATPVPGFAKELAGKPYLNAATFPKATFESTAFHPADSLHGTVEGRFTLLGQTRPVTLDVTLQGAGKGFMGHARLGVSATGQIDPREFGFNPMFATPIRLEIDAEFEQRS